MGATEALCTGRGTSGTGADGDTRREAFPAQQMTSMNLRAGGSDQQQIEVGVRLLPALASCRRSVWCSSARVGVLSEKGVAPKGQNRPDLRRRFHSCVRYPEWSPQSCAGLTNIAPATKFIDAPSTN